MGGEITVYRNIREFCNRIEKKYKERNAFWFLDREGREVYVTYENFLRDIRKAEQYFYNLDIHGRKICIKARNSYEWIVFFFGIMLSDNIAVLTDAELSEEEFAKRMSKIQCGYCLSFADSGKETDVKLTQLDRCDPGIPGFENKKAAVIMFTSGTTGEFKAVVLSEENVANAVIKGILESGYKDMMLVLPLHHSLGINALITVLSCGGTLGLNRNIKYLYEDIRRFQPELIFAVPSCLCSFIRRLDTSGNNTGIQQILGERIQAVLSGGGMLEQRVAGRIHEAGLKIYSSYGSTETFCIAGGTVSGKKGDVGTVCEHLEIRFREQEISVRGSTVALGYYNSEDENFEDDWYATGDLGYMDENGRLFLTGRKKNLIILSNGENVSPEMLEKRLYQIPQIKEVRVYGEDDRICAEIYTGLGTNENAQVCEQIRQMNREVQTFYQIHRITFRNIEFEKTALGKIRRG